MSAGHGDVWVTSGVTWLEEWNEGCRSVTVIAAKHRMWVSTSVYLSFVSMYAVDFGA